MDVYGIFIFLVILVLFFVADLFVPRFFVDTRMFINLRQNLPPPEVPGLEGLALA